AGFPRILSYIAAPDFSGSHRITAEVVIPGRGAEGVILSNGGRYGGFALYVKKNHLVYENRVGEKDKLLTSIMPLPVGKVTLAYEYMSDSAQFRQRNNHSGFKTGSGSGRLYVNGQVAGAIKLEKGVGIGLGSFGVGRAYGSAVSSAFELPFAFTGT